jgi:hypothetical protein
MRESRSYGSVRGALSNERPYREPGLTARRGHTNRNYGTHGLTHSRSAAITTHFRV